LRREKGRKEKRGGLGSIIKKEVKELLTWEAILPIIVIAIVYGMMGGMFEGVEEESREKPIIGIVNLDKYEDYTATLINTLYAGSEKVVYNGTNKEEGLERLIEENGAALIIVPEGFNESIGSNEPIGSEKKPIEVIWVMEGVGMFDSIPTSKVNALLGLALTEISRELMKSEGIDANTTLAPFKFTTNETIVKGKSIQSVSPDEISQVLTSQSIMIPIVIMMIIMVAGGTCHLIYGA
jgi:ABC-2 type transport system permease protein